MDSDSYNYAEKEIDSIIAESTHFNFQNTASRKSHSIVVIDDEDDFRGYLEMILSQNYNVYSASSGKAGVELVAKVQPHIVITDLMMEEMNGNDVCSAIRSDGRISYIPIVMLSGTADPSTKALALESGATVFLEKPFDRDYLLNQINILIKTQKELRELYSKKFIAEPSRVETVSLDANILSRAMSYIENNIDNSEYDVNEFVSDMALSRTLLYNKIKDLTGMSIKEFILDIRLKRAAQLLTGSDYTIAQISDMTGFSNPKYFAISFKRHFDATPSEYKISKGKKL